MTNLTRPVRRKVATAHETPLVVTLTPEGIWLREPRRRVAYLMPYGVAFVSAVRMHNADLKRQKEQARKARRAAR